MQRRRPRAHRPAVDYRAADPAKTPAPRDAWTAYESTGSDRKAKLQRFLSNWVAN